MLSIHAAAGGQGEYYVALARPDYYVAGGEPPGRWLGGAAPALGLDGRAVERDDFLALYAGRSPDGTAGVMNAGSLNRQPGWDLTFSAPKSVSTLWGVADYGVRGEIEAGHRASIDAVMAHLEDHYAFTRRTKGGTTDERAKILTAVFDHGTSRANDPQLHSHVFVLNWTQRADGTVGTLRSDWLYEHKMALGALYRAELAKQLESRLGLTLVRERTWFEVAGVPAELTEEFSKRRRDILTALAEQGVESAEAAAAAALDTRPGKDHTPRAELFPEWRAVAERHGLTAERVRGLCGPRPARDLAAEAEAAVTAAVGRITAQDSHFTHGELVRRTAEEAQCRGLGVADIAGAVDRHLATSPEIVRLGVWEERERFTTKEVLELEKDLMGRVEQSRADSSHCLRARTVEREIARRETITAEQAEALAHITLRPGAVQVVSGMAGTGKTYLLDAARACWEADGYRVLGAALSGKAAKGLEEGSGIESRTCAKFLMDMRPGEVSEEKLREKTFRSEAARQRYIEKASEPNLRLDRRTVVVVDEAGMLDTRHMEAVVREVTAAGGKVVLVGDARQLQPIGAGGPFRAIGRAVGEAELNQIIRQREGWARDAVGAFSRGDAAAALRAYSERGLVHVADDRAGAMRELIARWREAALADPAGSLIFAGEKREVAALNRMAQAERARDGRLGAEGMTVGDDVFHAGDRVLFTRNSRPLGLRNGDLGTVVEVRPGRGQVAVRLDSGQVVVVPLGDYDHVKLGYAITTHKGQGVTCEAAFVLAGGSMQDRHLTYVQASRARGETRLFIDKPEAGAELTLLARRMEQERFKGMASEVLRQDRAAHQLRHEPQVH